MSGYKPPRTTGGTADHTGLSNLSWTSSGHVGDANTFAAFAPDNSAESLDATDARTLLVVSQKLVWTATKTNTDSPFTAAAFDAVPCNSTDGIMTVKCPASPSSGDMILVKDVGGAVTTNAITIDGNGHNIGSSSTFVMFLNNQSVHLSYTGSIWAVI